MIATPLPGASRPHGAYCVLTVRTRVVPIEQRYDVAKHSKAERARRTQENDDVERIEAAWMASMPAATAKEFAAGVAAARARGPQEKPPDMAPGTAPRPPRPGREPKPREDQTRRRRY